jgi:hypothetical protein
MILVATPAHTAVTFDSQRRDVSVFATISLPEGENPFCSDEVISEDSGVFAETIDCQVGEQGSQATALAGQLSYISPQFFIAEGSFDAHAEISGEADFAEGLGATRFVSEFTADATTGIHFVATLYAGGNGATNIVFRVKDGEIFVLRTIHGDDSDEVDEWFTLDPGSYELTFVTSGYGQALPEGGGSPASGSFSGSIEFPTAAIATPPPTNAEGHLTPIAVPNPLRTATTLFPASGTTSGDHEILVLDLSGRLIRRFVNVGPAGVTWDARDNDGRPVAAGVYLARGGNGAATRVVVLR